MKNIKTLLIAEYSIALVLLGLIMYFFIAGGSPITGNVIDTTDSEDNSSKEPTEPVPTFIYVTNTNPTNSSYNQGVYSNIIVTFSEKILSSTVNSDTFILYGPNNISLTGTITSDSTGKIWTFNPTGRLEYDTPYTITLTKGIIGISGNTLLKDYIFNFTTHPYSGGSGGSSGGGFIPTQTTLVLNQITLTPTSRNISKGNSFQLNATGLDQNGNHFDTTINYNSSNETVANVSSSGLVTALSIGNTTLTASNESVKNNSIIIVVEANLTSISFSSLSKNTTIGNDFQLDVSGYDQNQDPMSVIISYNSSNGTVATVNSTGFVNVVSQGNTIITASNGSINNTFLLRVFEANLTSIELTSLDETLAKGNTIQLNATGLDQFNLSMDVVLNYASNDTSVAKVNSTGFVNATGEGTAIITVSNGTVSKNVALTIYSPILTKIELNPSSIVLEIGENTQLNATGLDQHNFILSTIISYNSSNESVATVNSTGFVNATREGNTTITTFNGLITNTSLIKVVNAGAECPAVSVNLGTAGDFAVLSKSGISTTGLTSIIGDMGVSPIDSTAITGFGLIMDPSGEYSTSSLVTGKIYAADYISPTPTKMTTAIEDMGTAYSQSNGLSACFNELGAGNIGGMTLVPGVYKWSTDLTMPTEVTLKGNATEVWVFQISGKLDLASSVEVKLSGGASAENIYWVTGDVVNLGTNSELNGNILSKTNINMETGARLNGRTLAQTAVTLNANTIDSS